MNILLQKLIILLSLSFFEKHRILGSKHINYLEFKDASLMIKKNKEGARGTRVPPRWAHLNQEGLEKVLQ